MANSIFITDFIVKGVFMFAVKGIYDGVSAKPRGKVPFNENYEVIITFVKPKLKRTSVVKKSNYSIEEKKELLELADFIDAISSDNPPKGYPTMKEIVAECKKSRQEIYSRGYARIGFSRDINITSSLH